jgi:hypothetical protein
MRISFVVVAMVGFAPKLIPIQDMRIVETSSRVTGAALSNTAQLVQNRIVAVGGSDVAAINLIRSYREITDTDAAQLTAARGDVQRVRQITTKLLEKWLTSTLPGARRVIEIRTVLADQSFRFVSNCTVSDDGVISVDQPVLVE